jgi:hypothetical protein
MMQPTLTCSPCLSALLCATLLSLTACGGGGGSGDSPTPLIPATPSTLDTSTLQGRWETASGASAAYTAIVVPASGNVATAWLLAQDASRLAKVSVNGTLVATGKSYALDGSAAQDVSGTLAASLTTTPKSLVLNNVLVSATTFNQSSDLAGMAVAADAAGNWRATASSVVANWRLTDTGVISGTSSTGCTYAGNYVTPTTVRLYALTFTETCAGTVTSFNGIATLNTDKSRLTVAATDSTGTLGTALFFVKQ